MELETTPLEQLPMAAQTILQNYKNIVDQIKQINVEERGFKICRHPGKSESLV